jgi:hypothetical protein
MKDMKIKNILNKIYREENKGECESKKSEKRN